MHGNPRRLHRRRGGAIALDHRTPRTQPGAWLRDRTGQQVFSQLDLGAFDAHASRRGRRRSGAGHQDGRPDYRRRRVWPGVCQPGAVRADRVRAARQRVSRLQEWTSANREPPVSNGGRYPIVLLANVNKFADTEAAFLYQADGVGLYRTEFGFLIRSAFPTEDEQYEFL